jgi:fluoroquinolone resistance protein
MDSGGKMHTTTQTQELYNQRFNYLKGFEQSGLDITQCSFSSCDLSEVHFTGILDSCVFTECNLSLTSFQDAKLQGVSFVNCKLEGVDFTKVNTLGLTLSFAGCLIRSCNFSFVELNKTSFKDSELADTDLIGCSLKQSSFVNAVFRNVTFHATNLEKADFTGASGYAINPLTNQIKGAKFSLPDAVSLLECMGVKLN